MLCWFKEVKTYFVSGLKSANATFLDMNPASTSLSLTPSKRN